MMLRMVRRGQQSRRAVRRAQRAAQKELDKKEGTYRPPPRSECTERPWHDIADDAGTIRVSYWTWRHEGRLVDFVIVVELTDWDSWATVARIDCCWGFCHVHPVGRMDEHEPIHRLDVIDDVEQAFMRALVSVDQIARTIRGTRGVDHE